MLCMFSAPEISGGSPEPAEKNADIAKFVRRFALLYATQEVEHLPREPAVWRLPLLLKFIFIPSAHELPCVYRPEVRITEILCNGFRLRADKVRRTVSLPRRFMLKLHQRRTGP
jgi:hypothetical protein